MERLLTARQLGDRDSAELCLTAREWAAMMDAPVRDQSYRQVTGLGPLIAEWLDYKRLSDRSERTVDQYERLLARLAKKHPGKHARDFTSADLMAFLNGMPYGSRRKTRAALSEFFKWAHIFDYLRQDDGTQENPMLRVPTIAKPRKKVLPVFEDDEENRLLALPDVRDRALMMLLLLTGIRDGEARQLRWAHVNEHAGTLFVAGKGRKERLVPLAPVLLANLAELAATDGLNDADYLWYTTSGRYRTVRRSGPVSYASFQRWWCRCLVEAHVVKEPTVPRTPDWLAWEKAVRASDGYRKPHMTRHTFATKFKRAGGDSSMLADLLGHESTDTVRDFYEHLDVTDLQRELGRILSARGLG